MLEIPKWGTALLMERKWRRISGHYLRRKKSMEKTPTLSEGRRRRVREGNVGEQGQRRRCKFLAEGSGKGKNGRGTFKPNILMLKRTSL